MYRKSELGRSAHFRPGYTHPIGMEPMDRAFLYTTTAGVEAEIERALFALIQAYADEPTPLSL